MAGEITREQPVRMKYVVIFASTFEEARRYARDRRLQKGCWTYASSWQRVLGLDPDTCEAVKLDGYWMNDDVLRAFNDWRVRTGRRAKPA
jgi:hypothetical protein